VQAEQPHHRARARGQQDHERLGRLGEELHRVRHRGRDLLRMQRSDALGHQLADQAEEEQHHQEAGDEAELVGIGRQQRDLGQGPGQLGAHGLAAEVADEQAQQGDPQLHRGQETLRVLRQLQRLARAPAVLGHLLQAHLARGHDRHLRHREEGVEQDQHHDDQQFQHARGSMR
jgi:hypothetical protein